MPETVENQSAHGEGALGGLTLLDLFQGMAGAWAFPIAVVTALGPASPWRFPAYVVGAVSGLLGAYYSRTFGSSLIRRVNAPRSQSAAQGSLPLGVAVYSALLGLTLLLQFGLYAALRLLINMARGS